mgnify:CR=1 FL=1
MSKVTLHFKILAPFDDAMAEAISRTGGVFGLERVLLNRSMDGLLVDYDASRLTLEQVESVLAGLGLPLARVVVESSEGVLTG